MQQDQMSPYADIFNVITIERKSGVVDCPSPKFLKSMKSDVARFFCSSKKRWVDTNSR